MRIANIIVLFSLVAFMMPGYAVAVFPVQGEDLQKTCTDICAKTEEQGILSGRLCKCAPRTIVPGITSPELCNKICVAKTGEKGNIVGRDCKCGETPEQVCDKRCAHSGFQGTVINGMCTCRRQ